MRFESFENYERDMEKNALKLSDKIAHNLSNKYKKKKEKTSGFDTSKYDEKIDYEQRYEKMLDRESERTSVFDPSKYEENVVKNEGKFVYKMYEKEDEKLIVYGEKSLVEKRDKGIKIKEEYKEVPIDLKGGNSSKIYNTKERLLVDVMDFVGNLEMDKNIKMNDMDNFKIEKGKEREREI